MKKLAVIKEHITSGMLYNNTEYFQNYLDTAFPTTYSKGGVDGRTMAQCVINLSSVL